MGESAILSWMVFAPTLGAALLAALPADQRAFQRAVAVLVSLVPFALSLFVWRAFDPADPGFQFVEQAEWIPRFGISYLVGIDGISLLLVLLTTFLAPLVLFASTDSIHQRLKGYLVSMLFLETAMLGTLVALDTILFYVFWELMLVPMFLIIGVWGGQRRIYAAIKFVLFTMAGSLPMLVALVYMGLAYGESTGQLSFALPDLYSLRLDGRVQFWACLAFAAAFAVKVPMWPLHTWLPDAHVEAPTGGSVILAGVLLKMGTYGFVRFVIPLFPDVLPTVMPWIATLAVVGIVYGALVAMVQPDMKKLVAYSSVSHLGFVMLGLASLDSIALTGAVYQMISHGLSTGALFLLVGMIYERRHTRMIAEFGGLWRQIPRYSVCFLIVMLASIGLPGLNGFVGEFLILLGSYRTFPVQTAVAVTGVILGAAYMLRMYQRVMFGDLDREKNGELEDMKPGEIAVMVPLVALIVLMGVYPAPFTETMKVSVDATLEVSDSPTAYARHARSSAALRALEPVSASPADESCDSLDRSMDDFSSGGCRAERELGALEETNPVFRNASLVIEEGAAQ
jgi:NADH-quinone oxidoreductase subunit M